MEEFCVKILLFKKSFRNMCNLMIRSNCNILPLLSIFTLLTFIVKVSKELSKLLNFKNLRKVQLEKFKIH